MIADPQARAIGAFASIDHPKEGRFETLGRAVRDRERRDRARAAPRPELGAHSREALAEHGFAPDEIRALEAEGVLG